MAFFDTFISSVNESVTRGMTSPVERGPHAMGRSHARFIYLFAFIDDAPHYHRITKVLVLWCIDLR